ncbi:MAG: GNAT family N-acetyltransferase [Pseudomonadales bacterium]|nr:GNAT family N-acetyltransferase [Pseudomonadales bacterium]
MELRKFNIREADWAADGKQLSHIRRLVFIVEQEVPQEEEWDGRDDESWHWIATDSSDVPIGTARLLPDGQIGRMAVLSEHRKHGVGAALLEQAVEKARHLGFEQVYLNAQTHALGFYERSGFVLEGEEFMEAGIPHVRMTQTLSPPVDNVQRKALATPEVDMSVKPFDTAEVRWADESRTITRIRRQVFETELKAAGYVAEEQEDRTAIHWIATNADEHVVGVVRMSPKGEIAHFAVIDDYRQQGVGTTLLELALQRARRFGLTQVEMTTHRDASILLANGFEADGADKYVRTIDPENMEVEKRENAGEEFARDVTYKLGQDKPLILLRRESDFQNIILEMARQAKQSIQIYSPNLSHDLFDKPELMQICSRLARRNRYTRVEILIFDPHRIIKNGHALLNISRKLPSSIGIKIVDPDMRQLNHEFMIVDGHGVIYRQDYESWEGTGCFFDITEGNRLGRQFTAAWESGLLDPNLRQLRI